MYSKYFGLARKPFALEPDPNIIYMSDAYKEAIAVLRYGFLDRRGFVLLTGEIGTGKTTMLRLLFQTLPKSVQVCFISNPLLSGDDFYYYLASEYNLAEYSGSKAKFLKNFEVFLGSCLKKGEQVLLVIDEAHLLSYELFEEIRLLANQKFQVLSIFLVGQPELQEKLRDPRLTALRQRIGLKFHLEPFPEKETGYYIKLRLLRSGAQRLDIFNDEAVALIYRASKGVPRVINQICDQALLTGFAANQHCIDAGIITECVKELDYNGIEVEPPAPVKRPLMARIKEWLHN
ncbi:MAG: hypothetical protein A2511_11395 [Deltaproteobacteria bacterium RIFOXYD12_FULL_50_9]|nr:MAG: hypothetical protein A2511_11395 [Deltaproteobacteria bacterium RIFOXYD12_FULL_50_9]